MHQTAALSSGDGGVGVRGLVGVGAASVLGVVKASSLGLGTALGSAWEWELAPPSTASGSGCGHAPLGTTP